MCEGHLLSTSACNETPGKTCKRTTPASHSTRRRHHALHLIFPGSKIAIQDPATPYCCSISHPNLRSAALKIASTGHPPAYIGHEMISIALPDSSVASASQARRHIPHHVSDHVPGIARLAKPVKMVESSRSRAQVAKQQSS